MPSLHTSNRPTLFSPLPDPKADLEATETLVGCAENLMSAVRQTMRETEAASVKLRSEAGQILRWKKK